MSPKLLLLSALPWAVSGHGFMVTPTIRNIRVPPFKYEPQSLGAFGPGLDIAICGRGTSSNRKPDSDKIVSMPTPGSQFKFQAKITAHHKGHMIVRVCPFVTSDTEVADLSNCIRLSGEGSDTWPLSAGTGMKEWVATLPSKAELESMNSPQGVFTIQWRYNTANSCAASSELGNSNCGETRCCSEVFTNCADVTFDGITHSPDLLPEAPKPKPTGGAKPGGGGKPTGGGGGKPGGGGKGKCYSTGIWKSDNMDAWCLNYKCGDDTEGRCDCSCSGSSGTDSTPESDPEPEAGSEAGHKIAPSEDAKKIFHGLEAFCKRNKAYFCDTMQTQEQAAGLCDCTPTSSSEPEGEAPEADPEPESDAEGSGDDSTDAEGSGDDTTKTCKQRCSAKCASRGHSKVNQDWGTPPFRKCVCNDGTKHTFTGCECKNSQCPSLMQVSAASTKFAGEIRQKMEISAHGEVQMD